MLKRCDAFSRYREPVITVDDTVEFTEKDVTFQQADRKGKLVDTEWKIPVKEYKLIPAKPEDTADRWSYLDPEARHQPSTWATGLTLTVSSIPSHRSYVTWAHMTHEVRSVVVTGALTSLENEDSALSRLHFSLPLLPATKAQDPIMYFYGTRMTP